MRRNQINGKLHTLSSCLRKRECLTEWLNTTVEGEA